MRTIQPTEAQLARVRREIYGRGSAETEWMRTVLIYGVPLGTLLLEADAAGIHRPLMSNIAPEWASALKMAEAITGASWNIGEAHEIAIRHTWGLWVPQDMHEWRVFRNIRAAQQVDTDLFFCAPAPSRYAGAQNPTSTPSRASP